MSAIDTRERIGKLAGNQAKIALLAIMEGTLFENALEIGESYPAEK